MYRTLLAGSYLGLLAVALTCSLVAVLGTGVIDRALSRTTGAHSVLEAHLDIEAAIFDLFKQLTDEVLTDDGSVDPDIAIAEARLAERLDRARALLASPQESGVSQDALGRLAQIEAMAATVFERLRDIDAADGRADDALIAEVLETLIDSELRDLIDTATTAERAEVAEAEASANAAVLHTRATAQATGGLALVICLAGLAVLLRRLLRPLNAFEAAARAVTDGEITRRFPQISADEFGRLAGALNRMLDELATRTAGVEAARDNLEQVIEQRTVELAKAVKALERADAMRRGFLADVSHELRTPLTIILGEAQVSLRDPASDTTQLRAALQLVAEQSAHCGQLVDDLLFIARSDGGVPPLVRETVDLPALARSVIHAVAQRARSLHVDVKLEASGSRPIAADAGRLRQVLMILLDNALSYSPAGGAISVTCGEEADSHILRVADQGAGIAPEDIDLIFERFHRGSNAPALKVEGSGLGLTIARAIATAHGGTLRVQSTLGEGSVFTLALPFDQGDLPSTDVAPKEFSTVRE